MYYKGSFVCSDLCTLRRRPWTPLGNAERADRQAAGRRARRETCSVSASEKGWHERAREPMMAAWLDRQDAWLGLDGGGKGSWSDMGVAWGGETHRAGVAHGSSSRRRTETGGERWEGEGRGKHGTDGMHGVDTSLLFNLGAGILQYVRMYVRMCKKTNNSAESQPPDPSKMPN